jgi:hypothetical protein
MLCNDFSKSPSLKHRQILLGRGALCTLLAKRLCFQNAVAVDSAHNHARAILLRGLSTVLRDAQATFMLGISWFSLRSFYLHIVTLNMASKSDTIVVMLQVRPGDSIENVMDRIIATSQIRPDIRLRLLCQGRELDPSKRVCDYGFIRPHTTLILVPKGGIRGG